MPLKNISISLEEQERLLRPLNDAFKDKSIDFQDQLMNLWAAENKLVKDYGREGLMMLLDQKTQVYVSGGKNRSLDIMHISEVPESCPWYHVRDLPLNEAILEIWEPFLIGMADDLADHAKDLFVILEEKQWHLVYPYLAKDYTGRKYYEFMGGRQPAPDAMLPKALLDAGWKMPEDLRDLYKVHGTFGAIEAVLRNDDTDAISSAEKLEASLSFLEKYVEEWKVGYSFFDLVPFCEDGAGNSQNFYKADPVGNSYITVDWDHETKEVSSGVMLEEFMDFHFGNKLKGYW